MKDVSKNAQGDDEALPEGVSGPEMYEFGEYRLDGSGKALYRAGRAVALTPKAAEMLVVLVRAGGRVVSKDELLRAVWPDTFVEEGVLAQNVLTLRKALGNPEWIETVPRRGYRFAAAVHHGQEMAVPGSSPGRRWAGLAGLGIVAMVVVAAGSMWSNRSRPTTTAAPLEVHSVAVLPFQMISREPPYLGLGLADVLINRLGTLPQIHVRPTSAIQKYADHPSEPLAAGRELRVDAVLEGHIQRDGERVRVTVQLWRLRDGAPMWSDKYDQVASDLFTLEDSIAERVANGLAVNLTAPERRQLSRRYTDNAEAWDAYLRGRYFWNRRTPEGHLKAIGEFQRATRMDPRYGLAYAGMADAYALLGSNPNAILPRAEAMAKARAAALRALELDGELAEAHTALAFILMHYDWNTQEAEKEYQRALALNPSYATAHQWRAVNLMATGKDQEAIAELRKAQALDPMSLVIGSDLAQFYVYTHQYRAAESEARRVLEIEPSFGLARFALAWALAGQSRYDEALSEAEKVPQEEESYRLGAIASLNGLRGRPELARPPLRRLLKMARQRYELSYNVAAIYGAMGDVGDMMPWLEKSLAERSGSLLLMNVDPWYAPVRDDPRVRAFVARVGLPQARP